MEGGLAERDIKFSISQDSDIGLTLENPMPVDSLPGFNEGLVSVQDESAQLIKNLMTLNPGMRVLDGCAAPGGKSCLVLESEPQLEKLTTVDLPERTPLIVENLTRLGLKASVVGADVMDTQSWWDGNLFNRILLDVPCSGSGVMRRHPDIKHRRRREDIDKFSQLQLQIMRAVWPLLSSNGELLYVTCSIFKKENDSVIEKFIQEIDRFELKSQPQCGNKESINFPGIQTNFGFQRLPGIHDGDGFYYALIKKL